VHELSVVASLLDFLLDQTREHKAQRVTLVKLRIGQLSGVVPELLQSAFEIYRKGTVVEHARLEINIVPIRVRCRACGADSPMEDDYSCSSCGSRDLEIQEGRELLVEKIELETDDP
jgi:hydrogenase nickel incorporation protein HypA/HybF